MMKAYALGVFGLLWFGGASAAQETTVAVHVAVEGLTNQDALVSPRTLDGGGLGLGHLTILHRRPGGQHEFRIGLRSRDLTSGSGFNASPASQVTVGDVSYAYTRAVGDRWGFGLAASVNVEHTEYEYLTSNAEAFLYLAALEAVARRAVFDGPHRLDLELRLPVVGWAARPPWSTIDEERLEADSDFFHRLGTGSTTAIGELWALAGRVGYRHTLSQQVFASADLGVRYTRYDDPRPFRSLRYGIDVGLGVRFGSVR